MCTSEYHSSHSSFVSMCVSGYCIQWPDINYLDIYIYTYIYIPTQKINGFQHGHYTLKWLPDSESSCFLRHDPRSPDLVKSQSPDLENPESQNWKGKIGKIQFGPPFFCCEKIPIFDRWIQKCCFNMLQAPFLHDVDMFFGHWEKPCQKSSKNLQLVGGLNPSEKY